ncbi:MAG: hypothetical protein ACK559_38090, partial [bacterium]
MARGAARGDRRARRDRHELDVRAGLEEIAEMLRRHARQRAMRDPGIGARSHHHVAGQARLRVDDRLAGHLLEDRLVGVAVAAVGE